MEPPVVAKRIRSKIALLVAIILVGTLVILLFALRQSQDIRNKAAVQNGPAQLVMTPSSTSITAGSPLALTLSANTQNLPLDGIQVVVRFSGSIPANLAFTKTVPTGFVSVRDTLRQDGDSTLHELLYTTPDPGSQPFRAEPIIPLGAYTGTAPQSGTMTVTFDTKLSKILQNGQAQDILRSPDNQSYEFVPGPTATATPTPTPDLRPVITTNSLPVPVVKKRYAAQIDGSSPVANTKLTMTISGLPQGLQQGNCTKSSKSTPTITCKITGQAKPATAGVVSYVTVTLADSLGGQTQKIFLMTPTK